MEENKLLPSISVHSFSYDRKFLAISDFTSKVFIYSTPTNDQTKWQKICEFSHHDSQVTSLAFHPIKYILLTCSFDRNAYVYELKDINNPSVWDYSLVITKLNLAALHCAWSPSGDRFALSSSKCISVCFYDNKNSWWVGSLIRKHRSSVLKVDWHPNGILLASGCSDYRVRIISTYNKKIDSEKTNFLIENFSEKSINFGEILCYYEDKEKSWIDCVKFNPKGDFLVFSMFNRKIGIIDCKEIKNNEIIKIKKLYSFNGSSEDIKALTEIDFIDNDNFVGIGFDEIPVQFGIRENGIFIKKGFKNEKNIERKKESHKDEMVANFECKSAYGLDRKAYDELRFPKEYHNNYINNVKCFKNDMVMSTSGIDGRVNLWNLNDYFKNNKWINENEKFLVKNLVNK